MTWRSEETISNQTLNDIFAVASTHLHDPRQALHSVAIMAADQANEEHRKYLEFIRKPQGILVAPNGEHVDMEELDEVRKRFEQRYSKVPGDDFSPITKVWIFATIVLICVVLFMWILLHG